MNKKTIVVRGRKPKQSLKQKIFFFFARQKIVSFFSMAILLIAIPLTVVQSLHIQDNRQHAEGKGDGGTTNCEASCQQYCTPASKTCDKSYDACLSGIATKKDKCVTSHPDDPESCFTQFAKDTTACETNFHCKTIAASCNNDSYKYCLNTCSSPTDCEGICLANGGSDTACKTKCSQTNTTQPTQQSSSIIQPECKNGCVVKKQTCTDNGCSSTTLNQCDAGCSQECWNNTTCSQTSSTKPDKTDPKNNPPHTVSCPGRCVDSNTSICSSTEEENDRYTCNATGAICCTSKSGASNAPSFACLGNCLSTCGLSCIPSGCNYDYAAGKIACPGLSSTQAAIKAAQYSTCYAANKCQAGEKNGTQPVVKTPSGASGGVTPGSSKPTKGAPSGGTSSNSNEGSTSNGSSGAPASPVKQTTCSDNPVIPASPNQIWRAYCSNKCVTSSDCKSLPGWPSDPGSSQCYQFTNGSYCLQLQYNNIAGLCRDNPVTPPAGLQWKAACGGKECSRNSDCPATQGLNNSNWCYGFDDGARCLQLQIAGASTSQVPTPPPSSASVAPRDIEQPKTNPLVNSWDAIISFFKKIF